jgi:hypothetical protein
VSSPDEVWSFSSDEVLVTMAVALERSRIPGGPWPIIGMTLVPVAVVLVLGDQSVKATETAAFDEFNQGQLVLATEATNGIELYFETLAADVRARRACQRFSASVKPEPDEKCSVPSTSWNHRE